MVNYLHDNHHKHAGAELGSLYDTGTLNKILVVTTTSYRRALIECLEATGITVVVPEINHRSNELCNVINALDLMGVRVLSVEAYLKEINKKQPAAADAPAAQERQRAVAG